jgi:muramoyltetrapeptide carboxypeptidase
VTHPQVEVLREGEASGMLIGGTLTQITSSLGTPFAFDPPRGSVLFLEDVGERPYRIDRMFTQLRLSGLLARVSALVFGEMIRCEEPGGTPLVRDVVAELVEAFPGPVLYGLPSGHTVGPTMTLPFGVRARVVTGGSPGLVIEEAAVV